MKTLFVILIVLMSIPFVSHAEEVSEIYEVEAGVVATQNMEIHGFNQDNATDGWSKSAPTFRLEYWRVRDGAWNFGLIFQPLSVNYTDTLRNDLNVKGKKFSVGDRATLEYQFPTLRLSTNKPIIEAEGKGYIRAGASAVVRYAKVGINGSGQSFTDTNLIVIPLINIEAEKQLSEAYSLFTRSDFLPGIDGNIFLDGLYDVYFGVRKKTKNSKKFDVGMRLFFGGYDPKVADDYANKIFFNSFVMRYSF